MITTASLAALLALAGSHRETPGADTPAELLRRIQSYYRDSAGIVADFTQVLESRSLPSPQIEKGVLYLRPPGKMRWEYSRPKGKLALSDGVRATLYLPEDRVVLMGPVEDLEGSALAARLLGGSASLADEFRVEARRAEGDAGPWALSLSPRRADFPYESVTLEASEDGAIRGIRMLDPLGNRITYRFDRIRADKDLSEKLFTFQIPRGVEIQTFGGGRAGAAASP